MRASLFISSTTRLLPMPSINPDSKEESQACTCRLCNGPLQFKFCSIVLNKYEIEYFECENCCSLQTQVPYWLEEAYGRSLSDLDTGAAQRNLQNLAASFIVSKLFGLNNVIDFGGGDGLLCRLLRDYNINCFVNDKFATPAYAQGFTQPDFSEPDLLLAFEVLEHFAFPLNDLNDIFKLKPKVLLVSTSIYTNEGIDWWYLTTESGQHIFFYSQRAIRFIAERYGYDFLISGGYILFFKPCLLNVFKMLLINVLINRYSIRVFRSIILMLPAPGVWADHFSKKSA